MTLTHLFFHGVANGRKRKGTIYALEHEGSILSSKTELESHILAYYKELFRSSPSVLQILAPDFSIHLAPDFWEAKTNTAPSPNGFPIQFYKFFWSQPRSHIFEMLQLLHRNELDLKRLNFDVITLVRKVPSPTLIKQYRAICVLNGSLKYISKVLTNRLSIVAQSSISSTQTAFIPGRFILDGCVILHEVVHELKVKKQQGIILKLHFEKS